MKKYISEKLNLFKDKTKNGSTLENCLETKIFFHSSEKSSFYKKVKTKIFTNKKIVTDSSFRNKQKNISELTTNQEKKIITNSPINITSHLNLNEILSKKKYPLKTINFSELKSYDENQENNCTLLSHSNINFNFSNNNHNNKFKHINLLQNNFKITKKCPMIC